MEYLSLSPHVNTDDGMPATQLNGRLQLEALRLFSQRELTRCLNSVGGGRKALVLDKSVSGPLGLVAEVRLASLSSCGSPLFISRASHNTCQTRVRTACTLHT
jgi:hypothetical protein